MTGPPPHYTSTQRPHHQSGRKEPTQCWWIYQNTEALLPHRQCYLDPDQPCVRDFWRFLLMRRGAHGASAPHAPQHTCKVCEIVTLNAVKVASDVSLLFIFWGFRGYICDKSDGISKGGIQDVQKSPHMHHSGLGEQLKRPPRLSRWNWGLSRCQEMTVEHDVQKTIFTSSFKF